MKITIERGQERNAQKIYIDSDALCVSVNGQKLDKRIDLDSFISRLLRVVSPWRKEYLSDNTLDGEWFKISIVDDGINRQYYGRGELPGNYHEFTALLEEVM